MNIQIYESNAPGQVIPTTLINPYSALTIPAYKRAMAFLSDNLASFERRVYKGVSPADPAHPLDKLLMRRPNRIQDASLFWKVLFFNAVHRGNGYARIERTGGFKIKALHHLRPDDICPFRIMRDGEVQQWYVNRATSDIYPSEDVIHLILGISHDGIRGMDPVELHAQIFQQAATLIRYTTKFLMCGTVVRATVEVPSDATEEQEKSIINRLRTFHMGPDAERDVLVLAGGATLKNATLTPEASQLVEQSVSLHKMIGQLTDVPPQFLFEMSEQKFNNSVEQIGQDVVRFTFRPKIEQIEDQLTLKLLTEAEADAGYRINLDPSDLLRGSTKDMEDIANASKAAGNRDTNEARALIGEPPRPEPEANKLKTLGDTAAPATTPEKTNKTAPTPDSQLSAIRPILNSACVRIDAKTEKAFSSCTKKTDEEKTIWANVFSGEQEKHLAAILEPIIETMGNLGLPALDGQKIAERYAAGIRKRVATGEATTLQSILDEMLSKKI